MPSRRLIAHRTSTSNRIDNSQPRQQALPGSRTVAHTRPSSQPPGAMEMHHKLRRDPSWDPRGCNLCGQLGHQAVECPNGTVNWKGVYGEDAFVLRPPVYESQLRERRQYKTVDADKLAARAQEYAKEIAAQQGLSWEAIEQAAEASQSVVITPETAAAAAAAAAANGAAAAAQPAAAAAGAGPPPEEGLPEGWAVAYDPQQRPYYYHRATQKTQWERPT